MGDDAPDRAAGVMGWGRDSQTGLAGHSHSPGDEWLNDDLQCVAHASLGCP
jgi:hypothetical protein